MSRNDAQGAQAVLPKLPTLPAPQMAGPTPWCNWVRGPRALKPFYLCLPSFIASTFPSAAVAQAIPGRVIAGAYPASLDDVETDRILTCLLELGMNTFVCLQAEVNINTPEHAWRSQHGLRPYIKDAQKILSRAHETGNQRIMQQKIDFLHLPVSACSEGMLPYLRMDWVVQQDSHKPLSLTSWALDVPMKAGIMLWAGYEPTQPL